MNKKNAENPILSGNIWKQLIIFSLPLLAANLLQQLYNAVDSIVVGRYVGGDALAAVGSTSAMVFLVIGFFQGIATGAGVVISQFIGGGEHRKVKLSIANAMIMSVIGGIVLGGIAYFMSPYMLRWILTPEDIFDMTNEYLQIYFLSIPFIAVYNTGSGILRSMGDSRKPLYFLVVCSIVNLILDIYFVKTLSMGVAGVAWATFIAQAVSVALIFIVFAKYNGQFNIKGKDYKLDMMIIRDIVKIGLPVAIQSSAVSFANVLFQSQVNIFGSVAVAGYSAGSRVTGFIYMPCTAMGIAATTFVGQNMGAGNYSRIKKIASVCMILSISVTLLTGVGAYIFHNPLLRIFTDDPEVIEYGILNLLIIGIPTFLWAFPHVYGAVITGTGKSFGPMVITMINMCGIRLVWIFFMLKIWYDIRIVFLAFPVSWISASIAMVIYYRLVMKKIDSMPDEDKHGFDSLEPDALDI